MTASPRKTPSESFLLIRQDLTNQAKSLSALVEKLVQVEAAIIDARILEVERKAQRDAMAKDIKDLREDFEHEVAILTGRVDKLYNLGLWILAAAGGVLLTSVANFILRGGLIVQ